MAPRRTGRSRRALLTLALAACCLIVRPGPLDAAVQGTFLYTLSNFSGGLRYNGVRVHVDQDRNEIYLVYQNVIRIFSPSGMEVFTFGDDLDLGHILDAVVDSHGDVFLLSYKDARSLVTRCTFRGVPIGPLEVRNLPEGLAFSPSRMFLRNGLFYFVTLNSSSVIITDANGDFREHIEFLPLLDTDEKQKSGAEVTGFTVDGEGNIFFTISVLFRVFKFSPDRKLVSFGRPGSAPGRFGIVSGIVTDSRGNLLVADKLRCVVMAFDKNFNFLSEFGYRGARPENLVVPDDLAIDNRDRVYVSQGRKRGVSVFALSGQ